MQRIIFCLIPISHSLYQVNMWNNICWLHCQSFLKTFSIKTAGQKGQSNLKLLYDLLKADFLLKTFDDSNGSNKINP